MTLDEQVKALTTELEQARQEKAQIEKELKASNRLLADGQNMYRELLQKARAELEQVKAEQLDDRKPRVHCILNVDSPSYPPEPDEYLQCTCLSCRKHVLQIIKERDTLQAVIARDLKVDAWDPPVVNWLSTPEEALRAMTLNMAKSRDELKHQNRKLFEERDTLQAQLESVKDHRDIANRELTALQASSAALEQGIGLLANELFADGGLTAARIALKLRALLPVSFKSKDIK